MAPLKGGATPPIIGPPVPGGKKLAAREKSEKHPNRKKYDCEHQEDVADGWTRQMYNVGDAQ
jgi:hypothetical protein